MKDTYQAVKDLTEKAVGAKSAIDALQYSQAALNVANALARTEEMAHTSRGSAGGGL